MSGEPSGFGVYIHIPFCRQRCHYCDFVSFERREQHIPAYLAALCREMRLRGSGYSIPVSSLYIGGGTPSLLAPAGIDFLLTACREHFALSPDTEVTLEVNPESTTPELLESALKSGVNRLSLGVHSLNDYILNLLGRLHTGRCARASFLTALGVGFENVSVDLMYGLPAQTEQDFIDGLREVIDWGPTHVSLYALTVVPGTEFYRQYAEGTLALLPEEMVADMYSRASQILEVGGFVQYELSNFARPGFVSVHNRVYWECQSYLGLGVAAHSYLDQCRFHNTPSLDEYLAVMNSAEPIKALERERRRVSPWELARDAFIMALRQSRGVDIEVYDRTYGTSLLRERREQIEALSRAGMIAIDDGRICLSPKGLRFSSRVFRQFLRFQ